MKQRLAGGLLVAPLLLALPAQADLATHKKYCGECHRPDSALVGPPWQSVARRYASNADAENLLASKIRGGSKGVWGAAVMPPAPQINDNEARKLARWVLQQQ